MGPLFARTIPPLDDFRTSTIASCGLTGAPTDQRVKGDLFQFVIAERGTLGGVGDLLHGGVELTVDEPSLAKSRPFGRDARQAGGVMEHVLVVKPLPRASQRRRLPVVHPVEVASEAAPFPRIHLCFLVEVRVLAGKQAHTGTDLLSQIDVEPIQEDVVGVDDAVEVRLEILHRVRHGGACGTRLELELGSLGREEELRLAEIHQARRVGDLFEDLVPDLMEVLRLQMIAQRLLGLIARRFRQASFHLPRSGVGHCLAMAGREVLDVVGRIVFMHRRLEDVVRPAG